MLQEINESIYFLEMLISSIQSKHRLLIALSISFILLLISFILVLIGERKAKNNNFIEVIKWRDFYGKANK